MTDYYLPITYDSTTKKISLTEDVSKSEWKDLQLEITQLNTLAAELISANTDIPKAPTPQSYNKHLSALMKKMHDSAVKSMKEKKYPEAIKQFSVGMEMNFRRPKFESFQMTLQEFIIFLIGRSEAYYLNGDYIDSFNDADLLCSLAASVPESHLRRGLSNFKLGNLIEAKSDFERGLSFNQDHKKLKEELENILKEISKQNGEDYYIKVVYEDEVEIQEEKEEEKKN
ncbi:hypothetical protein PACTADRAFT_51184 [Pachysolen tannophilus NRRL Y-2460]|uniref:Tetratricopeptide SHNi-TPR domain-containing protein n=1 Tax=Pachysolen tannophilus NRRL Y-2460 TaxID=669874 RepID=A0A1E4TRE7_PACTA|nr:hypothetical protein PACTADRAFT_51184 [Pachysolen tannophilus NRRL Y-2460]